MCSPSTQEQATRTSPPKSYFSAFSDQRSSTENNPSGLHVSSPKDNIWMTLMEVQAVSRCDGMSKAGGSRVLGQPVHAFHRNKGGSHEKKS